MKHLSCTNPALIHALTQAAFAEYGREPGTSTALKETEADIARQFAGGMEALVVYGCPHPGCPHPGCPHPPAPSPHVLSSLQASRGEGESEGMSPLSQRGSEERGDVGRGAGGEGSKGEGSKGEGSKGEGTPDEGIACVRYQIEGDALYFHRLSVHPDYRRQGLAKKLIGHLEALARAQGLTRLTCSVRLAKADNVALYTGLGFQLLGERSVCRDGTAVPTGDFEKRLA